jgi:hypothetical protein
LQKIKEKKNLSHLVAKNLQKNIPAKIKKKIPPKKKKKKKKKKKNFYRTVFFER